MDDNLRWEDFYGIEIVDGKYKVMDIDDFCYLATCDTYEQAVKQAEKYFDGLKKIWK